jgi:hypothetical protein
MREALLSLSLMYLGDVVLRYSGTFTCAAAGELWVQALPLKFLGRQVIMLIRDATDEMPVVS